VLKPEDIVGGVAADDDGYGATNERDPPLIALPFTMNAAF
jgi:hypothetical protein